MRPNASGRSWDDGVRMELQRWRAFRRLVQWLSPWTPARALPRGVHARRWVLRDGDVPGRRGRRVQGPPRALSLSRLEALVLEPEGDAIGTYLVAPGLHFDGPLDPRFERFCRILAHAGFRVVAPILPAYAELLVHPSAATDFELVARSMVSELGVSRFTVFSISFGSWPALHAAARVPDSVDAVITFGGYAEFDAAVRFAVDGVMRRPEGNSVLARDPLNQPALFLNMLPYLGVPAEHALGLAEAWREMTYQTWGRMELKQPGRLVPFAEALAARVPRELEELFLKGTGIVPGGAELVARALERAGAAFAFASPLASLRDIACPMVICHGRDDDVIPWNEAEKLHAAARGHVPARLLLTGLYGHTGAARPALGELVAEGETLVAIAHALASGGRNVTDRRAARRARPTPGR